MKERTRNASLHPRELRWVEHEFPVILGRDFAGVVERVGSGIRRYRTGDEVYGFVLHANPTVREGSWAELIVFVQLAAAAGASGSLEQAGEALQALATTHTQGKIGLTIG